MNVFAIDPGAHAGWAIGSVAHGVHAADAGNPPPLRAHVDAIVIERPVIRPGVDGNSILTLAINVGRWVERYKDWGPLYLVPPSSWKAGSKTVHHAAVRKTLNTRELLVWDALKTHDARDAMALCHWALKLLRVAPPALAVHAYTPT